MSCKLSVVTKNLLSVREPKTDFPIHFIYRSLKPAAKNDTKKEECQISMIGNTKNTDLQSLRPESVVQLRFMDYFNISFLPIFNFYSKRHNYHYFGQKLELQ